MLGVTCFFIGFSSNDRVRSQLLKFKNFRVQAAFTLQKMILFQNMFICWGLFVVGEQRSEKLSAQKNEC